MKRIVKYTKVEYSIVSLVSGEVKKESYSVTFLGIKTEEQILKILKKQYKDYDVIINLNSCEGLEETRIISLEDFIKYSHVEGEEVEEDETEVEEE